jgi:hypothetical protein
LRPWRIIGVALIWLLAGVAASYCVPFLLGFISGLSQALARADGATGWRMTPLIYSLAATVALQATVLLADYRQGRMLGNGDIMFGLGAGPARRPDFIVVLAVLMVAWVCVYLAALIHFQGLASSVSTGLPAALAAQMSGRPIVLAIRLVLIVAVAPVAEELFFRGWLWTALRQSWNAWPTALVTAGLWLVVHALDGPVRMVILLPQAILLSLARHYGGSVRASLPIHVVNNVTVVGIQIAAVLLWSQ